MLRKIVLWNIIEYQTVILFLDDFIEQLDERFLEHRDKLKMFYCLLPKPGNDISVETFKDFKIVFSFYTNNVTRPLKLFSSWENCHA